MYIILQKYVFLHRKYALRVMKILLVDNYDSFVYNIVGLLQQCRRLMGDIEWDIAMNDNIPIEHLNMYDAVILSPGPGLPAEAGDLMELIGLCVETHPVLGICLGCQAIAEYYGAKLSQLTMPRHGHVSQLCGIVPDDRLLGPYAGVGIQVGRYHSWVIDEPTVGKDSGLEITSRDEEGNVMSIAHSQRPVYGLQFHPESVNTPEGLSILLRFLSECRSS